MPTVERIDEYRRRRRHHERHNPTRFQLARLILWLFGLVDELIELLERGGHHHHDSKGVIVQVQITESQEVRLHAVEENAEGEPIDRDTATCVWTTDRQDVITLGAVDDDAFAIDALANGGGTFGDTIVTATVTEPDTPGTDNGDGTSTPATPGAVYVGTQVVSVAQDEQISQVEIQADAPTEKVA